MVGLMDAIAEEMLVKGRDEGLVKGRDEGLAEATAQIVLHMLKKYSAEEVADVTGVPLSKVKEIERS